MMVTQKVAGTLAAGHYNHKSKPAATDKPLLQPPKMQSESPSQFQEAPNYENVAVGSNFWFVFPLYIMH